MAVRPTYETHVKPKLADITQWCRDGLLDRHIAKKLGIGYSTLQKWKKEHPELVEAMLEGKEYADEQVQNALFQRAIGMEYDEIEERIDPDGNITRTIRKKILPSDTTALIFWLKNRQKEHWNEKIQVDATVNYDGTLEISDEKKNELLKYISKKLSGDGGDGGDVQ